MLGYVLTALAAKKSSPKLSAHVFVDFHVLMKYARMYGPTRRGSGFGFARLRNCEIVSKETLKQIFKIQCDM